MTKSVRVASLVFAITAATILSSAVLAAWAIDRGGPDALRLPFRLLCHGIEPRSFAVGSAAMPICARCSGIYLGMLGGIAGGLFLAGRGRIVPGVVAALLIVPLALDGTTQALGLRESGNLLRFVTGILTGAGGMAWVVTRLSANAVAALERRESGLQC